MKSPNISLLLSMVALAALTACGGGSDASGTPPVSTPPVSTVPVPTITPPASTGSIVTVVTAPSYAPIQEEFSAYATLNAERQRCGFGLLVQNIKLDTAARGHATWLLSNDYSGHFQTTPSLLFTGFTPSDRMVNAGYASGAPFLSTEAEIDAGGGKTGQGIGGVRSLLNAPYHLMGMLRGFKEVGISVMDKNDLGLTPNNRFVVNIDLASDVYQAPVAGTLRTYPCEGSTGMARSLNNETPNPVPGRDLRVNPLGSSIGVVVDTGHTLVISSASMVKATTGTSVPLINPVVGSTDPYTLGGTRYMNNNEGFISAAEPLEAGTLYRVTFDGSDNGVAFQPRTFTFTTGN